MSLIIHADHFKTMNITLELWDDQSEIGNDIKTSMWVMKLNEKMFPSEKDSVMTLAVAHQIVNKLLEIEEIAYNDEP